MSKVGGAGRCDVSVSGVWSGGNNEERCPERPGLGLAHLVRRNAEGEASWGLQNSPLPHFLGL